jgi:hypothetical protein
MDETIGKDLDAVAQVCLSGRDPGNHSLRLVGEIRYPSTLVVRFHRPVIAHCQDSAGQEMDKPFAADPSFEIEEEVH